MAKTVLRLGLSTVTNLPHHHIGHVEHTDEGGKVNEGAKIVGATVEIFWLDTPDGDVVRGIRPRFILLYLGPGDD